MNSYNLSIEFFPPKTSEGVENLRETRSRLAGLEPKYFSVTFGAGGSTQQGTHDTALEIHKEGYESAPHISCIDSSRESVREKIHAYKSYGIKHLVALRGDLPSSYGVLGEFHYANELVEFIRHETGDWFHIDVAAYPEMHPQAKSPQADLNNFVGKMKAGADAAVTQYFYNPDAYFYFVDQAQKAGVTQPIIAGIMPITNCAQIMRFSDMCGAEIPRWIRTKLMEYENDLASIRAFGVDVVTNLCDRLITGGAPGLHFYSLNKAYAIEGICKQLGFDKKR